METQRSFFLPNSGHARRSDKNKFTSRLSFAHSATCFFFFFFFLNMLNDGWLVLDLDLEMYKKINWLDQLEWISLNWRSPHFFFSQSLAIHIFCYFFPNGEKIVYFSKEFFFFLFLNIKKWLIYISHTVLRMTTMELEASLYPLASDNISSIMSNSGSGKSHENVGTRRRKVKTQKHNRTVFQSF